MDPEDIKIKPKIRVKPKSNLSIKAKEVSPDEIEFRKKADELRGKIAKRDPSLTTTTRLKPTAVQLRKMKD